MLPSIQTLESAFPGKGRELRRYLEASREALAEHPAGAARIAECYHPPKTYDVRLHVLNAVAETYSVEYVTHKKDTCTESYGFDYLNVGDFYVLTIMRSAETGRYIVACCGDIVERNPNLV